jgi:hypothetical protein
LLLLVLGQGGHWAPVAGFDGGMPESSESNPEKVGTIAHQDEAFSPELSMYKTPNVALRTTANDIAANDKSERSGSVKDVLLGSEAGDVPHVVSERVGCSKYISGDQLTTSHAHVLVGKKHGDGIYVDDPAFLAEWSVDAMKLIRKQLRRAGNGRVLIPFEDSWSAEGGAPPSNELPRVTITDIPLLTAEVSALLDIMENVMEIQRFRRLEHLRAPSWFRSNWYVVASAIPLATIFIRRLSTKGYGRETIKFFIERVVSFFRERVVDPVVAM